LNRHPLSFSWYRFLIALHVSLTMRIGYIDDVSHATYLLIIHMLEQTHLETHADGMTHDPYEIRPRVSWYLFVPGGRRRNR
jgi:hypothetical protein